MNKMKMSAKRPWNEGRQKETNTDQEIGPNEDKTIKQKLLHF